MIYPAVTMTCDFTGHRCRREVRRAPRIIVPSRTPLALGHGPWRIMTTLHYCDLHRDTFHVEDYWTDAIKARVEQAVRHRRPPGFQPDFDAARVELLLVTTPEYRQFMHDLGARPDAA